jgi:hypothetical protein
MRILLTSLLLFCGFCAAQAADVNGALAALNALPLQYRSGVLKVSADNGVPNPTTWYIVAKNSRQDEAMYQIAIAQGQVISEKISLDLRAAIKNSSIDLSKVLVDSAGAWAAGEAYCTRKGKKLGNASYALQQQGRDAAPVWSIWCYDANVKYIGLVKVLATTGAVISSE